MSFVGIVNEQEFYSQHFLDEVFMTSDAVKAAVKAYEDRETESKGDDGKAVYRAPWRVLASKARESRLMLQSLAETADPEERYRAEREFIRGMLRLFDLPADCTDPYFVTDSLELPLIGETHELRTPLTLLQTQLELFPDEHPVSLIFRFLRQRLWGVSNREKKAKPGRMPALIPIRSSFVLPMSSVVLPVHSPGRENTLNTAIGRHFWKSSLSRQGRRAG